jgi:hypothetical protein
MAFFQSLGIAALLIVTSSNRARYTTFLYCNLNKILLIHQIVDNSVRHPVLDVISFQQ